MLRIPHCLDNRLIDGSKFVSPTHRPPLNNYHSLALVRERTNRPPSTPQKHYFSASGTHFCQRLSKPQSLVKPEGLGKLKKSFAVLPGICLQELRKTIKDLSQDNQIPHRDWSQTPPEHAFTFPLHLTRKIIQYWKLRTR
jgi:hypothetical protein